MTPGTATSKPQVSSFLYHKSFNKEFNMGFGHPRTNTCARCDEMAIAIIAATSPEERRGLEKQKEEHQKKAEEGFQSKTDDKKAAIHCWRGKRREIGSIPLRSKDALNMITYDFQHNLEMPPLRHKDVFYACQLWTYNFGIHDCVANKGIMNIWPETLPKRGSAERAFCLETWGEETTASGTHRLVHHPHQVWFQSTFSRQEPWTKVDLVIKEEDRR